MPLSRNCVWLILAIPQSVRSLLFYILILPFLVPIWTLLFVLRLISLLKHTWYIIRGQNNKINRDLLEHPAGISRIVSTSNEINIEIFESGPVGGPLMLFIHGFPESPYSYRHQIKEFSSKYRCVAVSLRGYGNSSKPGDISQYRTTAVINDFAVIIKNLGYKSAVVVGHDWGGSLAWAFAGIYKDMVSKLVILSGPHMGLYVDNLSLEQLLRSFYFVLFQVPLLPEIYFELNYFEVVATMIRKDVQGRKTDLSAVDIEATRKYFSEEGVVTPALNYYRNLFLMSNSEFSAVSQVISIPCLVIWGDSDRHLKTNLCNNLKNVAPNSQFIILKDCSHWVQMDKPQEVNQHMKLFL